MLYLLLTCYQFVGKVSALGQLNRPTSFRPSGVIKRVVNYAITWIMGVETVKWNTKAVYNCLIAGKVCGHRLRLRPIGCMPALSVTQNAPLQLPLPSFV